MFILTPHLKILRTFCVVLSTISFLLSPLMAKAEPKIGETLSFNELENRLRVHPALDALGYSAQAERSRAEGALSLPDPTVSLGINNLPLVSPSFTEYLPTNKYFGVSQSIPNAAKRKAMSLQSLKKADQTELQIEMEFFKLRADLLSLLIDKKAISEMRALTELRDQKYQELLDITEIEMTSGEIGLVALTEIETRQIDLLDVLEALEAKDAEFNAQLIALVGTVPNTPLPEIEPKLWNGQALSFYAVQIADAFVDIKDAAVQKAEANFKPDLGIKFSYQQRESGQGAPRSNFDGDDWVSGGVTFTLPLWQDKRQKPFLNGAKLDRSAAQANRMAMARKTLSDWKRYDARRTSAEASVENLKLKIASLKKEIASKLITYESGEGDYGSIIEGEIAVLILQEKMIKTLARRDKAIVKMNSMIGDRS